MEFTEDEKREQWTRDEVLKLIEERSPIPSRPAAVAWFRAAGWYPGYDDSSKFSVEGICEFLSRTGMPTCWITWARENLKKEEEWPEITVEGTAWWAHARHEGKLKSIFYHGEDGPDGLDTFIDVRHPHSFEICCKMVKVYNAWRKLPKDKRDYFLRAAND